LVPLPSEEMAIDNINAEPMSRAQLYAIAVCVFLVALDGFDVLAIAFAAPGISAE